MHLTEILEKTSNLSMISGLKKIVITDVVNDSKKVKKGSLFCAIPGEKYDGHNYIDEAIEFGASVIVHDGRKIKKFKNVTYLTSNNMRETFSEICSIFWSLTPEMIVSVTGTNGKTSTVEYLRQLWNKSTWNSVSMGTLGINSNHSDFQNRPLNLTTPSSEEIFFNLHKAKSKGISNFAFEASSHGLKQARLSNLGVNIAVFTNLSRDHLDWHKDMDDYFESKVILFEKNLLEGGIAVINIDDKWGEKLVKRLKRRNIVIKTFSQNSEADFVLDKIISREYGFDINLKYKNEFFKIPIPLQGDFQIRNAIMAAITAFSSGLPFQNAFGNLSNLIPIPGRMEPVYGHPNGSKIIIDYAHTPEALKHSLKSLKAYTKGSLYLVFGCGGDRDVGKRKLMGEVANNYSDFVFVTDDNPRKEDPENIRKQIIIGCPKAKEISPREIAIKKAISYLKMNDTLLIAGKGHETFQLVGTETLPFDDVSIAKNAVNFLNSKKNEF